MLLYYITDRKQLPGGEAEQRRRLLSKIAEAAKAGVDYVQLREKDLSARAVEELAREAVTAVRENSSATRLLINSRVDVAIGCCADGVHLTSTDISAGDARAISGIAAGKFVIACSTHSISDVQIAFSQGADMVVFGPVFEKVSAPAREGVGIDQLRRVCAEFRASREHAQTVGLRVLALGGVSTENARVCAEAGASGVAAIRLFQENRVREIVRTLRDM